MEKKVTLKWQSWTRWHMVERSAVNVTAAIKDSWYHLSAFRLPVLSSRMREKPSNDWWFVLRLLCWPAVSPPLDSTVSYIPPRGQMLLLPLVLRTIVKWTIPDKSFKPRQQLCSRLSNKKITFSLHSHSLIPSCRRTLFSAADNDILFSGRCRTWGRTTPHALAVAFGTTRSTKPTPSSAQLQRQPEAPLSANYCCWSRSEIKKMPF